MGYVNTTSEDIREQDAKVHRKLEKQLQPLSLQIKYN